MKFFLTFFNSFLKDPCNEYATLLAKINLTEIIKEHISIDDDSKRSMKRISQPDTSLHKAHENTAVNNFA